MFGCSDGIKKQVTVFDEMLASSDISSKETTLLKNICEKGEKILLIWLSKFKFLKMPVIVVLGDNIIFDFVQNESS